MASKGRYRVKETNGVNRTELRQQDEGIWSTFHAASTFMLAAHSVDPPNPDPHPELPVKQRLALRAIAVHQARFRTWPTMKELATALGVSPKTNPEYVVRPLREKGYLVKPAERAVRSHRVLELTDKAERWLAEDERRAAAGELRLQPPP